ISFVSISSLNQFYDAYQYRRYFSFNQIFYNAGFQPGVVYLAMNTQMPPPITMISAWRSCTP
ncbi:hypothetical protein B9Q04_05280, partial [Candidatus Marsarchaeota G2 archaeon BE_D]